MTDTTSTRPQMGDELLPCPLCGASADPPELYGESKTAMFVACSKCGANVYHGSVDKEANRAAVVAAWNRRASLPQPTAGSTGDGEAKRLSFVIERDRARCAEILTAVRRAIRGHEWLRLGRGSYEYDDERWKEEFGAAIDGIEEALKPLVAMARDWTDCPTKREEILAARASTPAQSGMVEECTLWHDIVHCPTDGSEWEMKLSHGLTYRGRWSVSQQRWQKRADKPYEPPCEDKWTTGVGWIWSNLPEGEYPKSYRALSHVGDDRE